MNPSTVHYTHIDLHHHCIILFIIFISFCRFEGRFHFSGSKLLIWHISLNLRFWELRKLWVLFVICIALFCTILNLSAWNKFWCTLYHAASSSRATFSWFKKKIWQCFGCWSCQQGAYSSRYVVNFRGLPDICNSYYLLICTHPITKWAFIMWQDIKLKAYRKHALCSPCTFICCICMRICSTNWAIHHYCATCSYQHGGEGRLCENFGNAMQNVASDDVR